MASDTNAQYRHVIRFVDLTDLIVGVQHRIDMLTGPDCPDVSHVMLTVEVDAPSRRGISVSPMTVPPAGGASGEERGMSPGVLKETNDNVCRCDGTVVSYLRLENRIGAGERI